MNKEIYHFKDFTQEEYVKLILSAKSNFTFVNYTELKTDCKFVLWRHDVDFSMHKALDLAKIEHEMGIKATYFLMLHSEFYNLLEKEISDIVKEIINLGHSIGIHFDTHYYDVKEKKSLEKHLLTEKNIIETFFDVSIDVFSFHNTTDFTMSCKEWQYAGLINTYAEIFQKEISYCSDSNGFWRFRRLLDVLNEPNQNNLQVLTHPEWWTKEVLSPKQKIDKCIDGRAIKNHLYYENTLKRFGRENIDW